jgi:hypothetical protein
MKCTIHFMQDSTRLEGRKLQASRLMRLHCVFNYDTKNAQVSSPLKINVLLLALKKIRSMGIFLSVLTILCNRCCKYPLVGGNWKMTNFQPTGHWHSLILTLISDILHRWSSDNNFNINMPHKMEHRLQS